jgi:hypothetical protein
MSYLRQFIDLLFAPLRAMLSAPGKISTTSRKLASISLPARVAILVAVFLIILLLYAFGVYFFLPEQRRIAASAWWTPQRMIILAALAVPIPYLVYKLLQLWLQGEISRYPDIDFAWKAGIAELQANGLDLTQVPLFVVLGSNSETQEKALLDAAQVPLRVRGIPNGSAALHWFGNPDGIYLMCSEVGCLSKLAVLAKRAVDEVKAAPVRSAPRGGGNVRETMRPGDVRGTMMLGGGEAMPAAASRSKPSFDPRGTIVAGYTDEDEVAAGPVEKTAVTLSPADAAEQERRLAYLCSLITQARQPLCPINGVLTLLPFSIVQTGRLEGVQLQRVVKRDVSVLTEKLGLRCPVTAVVTGLEEESGFREMVRRVGRERAIPQRFGKGFDVWNPPEPEQLEALSAHACGAFEDQVYALFREKGALAKPGNTKLYALLCKIRHSVQNSLTNTLIGGYSTENDKESSAEPLLFGGCYFAGTGDVEDRQAFVKSVFEKLIDQQNELEWTQAAVREEDRYRRWSQSLMWIDAALLVSVVAMVIFLVFYNRPPS